MNWDSLHDKLIGVARQHPPAGDVPYAFEHRVMARVRAKLDPSGTWAGVIRAFWGAAGACAAIAIAISIWSAVAVPATDSFTEDLEATILASVFDLQEFDPDIEPLW